MLKGILRVTTSNDLEVLDPNTEVPPVVMQESLPSPPAQEKQKTAPVGKQSNAAIALQVCEESGLVPFCDELAHAYVELPDDPTESIWPLSGRRVKAWLSERFFEKSHCILSNRDLEAALLILEGRAWKNQRRPPMDDPTWHTIEKNPTAVALVMFANLNGGFDGRTRELFKTVTAAQITGRMGKLSSQLPSSVQAFSRHLKRLIPVLKVIGLEVTIGHQEDGSHCKLVVNRALFIPEPDGIVILASGLSSHGRSRNHNSLERSDAPDGSSNHTSIDADQHTATRQALAALRKGNK